MALLNRCAMSALGRFFVRCAACSCFNAARMWQSVCHARSAWASRGGILSIACRAGLFAVAFGSAYCQLLLRLAYGERWAATGAPAALAAYCPYILLLAVNGILEAFVHAVATPRELAAGALCPALWYGMSHRIRHRTCGHL